MTVRNLFLLPGDGIGPEAMAEVRKIIAYMNAELGAGFVTDEGLGAVCPEAGEASNVMFAPPAPKPPATASARKPWRKSAKSSPT
ncbi:hypothetical protein ASE29_10390 [Ensifer sp. Root74]|nr:hypothetical protein ASE29_10390 [Ensifer sp. Root74]